LRLSASNDMNPANDSRDVAVQISGAAVASASAPGGGGGGRIEFWMLGLLAALAVRRHRVRNFVTE
jgi:MYXO-CTERM domain-containing protein